MKKQKRESGGAILWYVLQADRKAIPSSLDDNGREPVVKAETVMERLEAIGCEVFCPKARIVRERLQRGTAAPVRERLWVPVFGRYLFAGTSLNPGAIREVRGVRAMINNVDGVPGVVPADAVEELRRKYRNYRMAIKYEEVPLKPGQKVRIMEGPFRGYDAQVELVDLAKGLAEVARDVMGRKISLKLPVGDLEVLGG